MLASPQRPTAIQTDNTVITALGRWGDANIRYFDGRMENVRVWTSALSSTTVSNIYNNCTEPSLTGCIAYWKFNENGGSTVIDFMGNYNGTVHNTTWVPDGPCGWYPRFGNPDPDPQSSVANDPDAAFDFNLYPNPADNFINVEPSKLGAIHLLVYDISGNLVAEPASNTIDLADIAPGIYFVVARDENGMTKTKKFIRQ
jgi:hypothetical protein